MRVAIITLILCLGIALYPCHAKEKEYRDKSLDKDKGVKKIDFIKKPEKGKKVKRKTLDELALLYPDLDLGTVDTTTELADLVREHLGANLLTPYEQKLLKLKKDKK